MLPVGQMETETYSHLSRLQMRSESKKYGALFMIRVSRLPGRGALTVAFPSWLEGSW